MIKLPEPYSTVGRLLGEVGTFAAMGYNLRRGDGLYTESQMRQAIKDALEGALNCYSPDDTATDWADKIKALKESV